MAHISDSPLELLCSRLSLRHSLEPEERSALLDLDFEFHALPAASFLVRTDKHIQNCSILVFGIAYRSKMIKTGERQIVSVHTPGEVLDLQNFLLDVADHDIRMLTDTTLALVSRKSLVDLAFKYPSIGRALWYESLVEQSIYREWLTNIGRRNSIARIAHFLCELCLRLEHTAFEVQQGYELPMSQEQIADCVGLTSVHVNRTLRQLETMGLISRTKRLVHVADWNGLSNIGDFSPEYLHLPMAKAA